MLLAWFSKKKILSSDRWASKSRSVKLAPPQIVTSPAAEMTRRALRPVGVTVSVLEYSVTSPRAGLRTGLADPDLAVAELRAGPGGRTGLPFSSSW